MFEDEEDLNYLEGRRSTIWMMAGGAVLLLIILVLCVMIWRLYHEDSGGGNGLDQQYAEGSESLADPEMIGPGGSGEEPGDSVGSEGSEAGNEDSENLEGSEGSGEGSGNLGDSEGMQDASGAGEAGGDSNLPEGGTNGGNANLPEDGGNGNSPEGGNAGEASNTETPSAEMSFQDVDETVTAKEITNLRSVPSTASSDTVVTQLSNGQTARRTGINEDTGWSRLEYEGQVLYASSRLLTTDLTAKPPQNDSAGSADDNTVVTAGGRKITFTPCDDVISPKTEVNLRGEPATDQGNASVHYRLKYGETAHRTGIDEASGWSRVEYNGEVLYVVTSYIIVVEPETGTEE